LLNTTVEKEVRENIILEDFEEYWKLIA